MAPAARCPLAPATNCLEYRGSPGEARTIRLRGWQALRSHMGPSPVGHSQLREGPGMTLGPSILGRVSISCKPDNLQRDAEHRPSGSDTGEDNRESRAALRSIRCDASRRHGGREAAIDHHRLKRHDAPGKTRWHRGRSRGRTGRGLSESCRPGSTFDGRNDHRAHHGGDDRTGQGRARQDAHAKTARDQESRRARAKRRANGFRAPTRQTARTCLVPRG